MHNKIVKSGLIVGGLLAAISGELAAAAFYWVTTSMFTAAVRAISKLLPRASSHSNTAKVTAIMSRLT